MEWEQLKKKFSMDEAGDKLESSLRELRGKRIELVNTLINQVMNVEYSLYSIRLALVDILKSEKMDNAK